jgi:hypothetical protein
MRNETPTPADAGKHLHQPPPLVHNISMTNKKKNPAAVKLGRLGGKVKGPCKARTPEQARKAAFARWKK